MKTLMQIFPAADNFMGPKFEPIGNIDMYWLTESIRKTKQ
jgi:hypothetical protein